MLSYIIPYRGSTPERERNLAATLRWLATQPAAEVLVVEQDSVPRLPATLPHPAARVLFTYNPGPFNKSWGLNVGVRHAGQDIVALADGDLIVADGLAEAVAACRRGFAIAKPYRHVVDLDEASTVAVAAALEAGEPLPPDLAGRDRGVFGERIVLAGGVLVMRRDAYARLGGYDERFVGWGGEDDALTHRIERTRTSTAETGMGVALHLAHERTRDTTVEHAHYPMNAQLLASYPLLDDASLARLAEVGWQLAGNARKYVRR